MARIRQGNIDKKESVSISDIIHNYEIAFGMIKNTVGKMDYFGKLVLSDGITTVSDIHLVFSDNIVKVRPVPLPPPIDISLKDRTEIGNILIYGLQLSSANYISIADTKPDEFKDLKVYLNGVSTYTSPSGSVPIDDLSPSDKLFDYLVFEEGEVNHVYSDKILERKRMDLDENKWTSHYCKTSGKVYNSVDRPTIGIGHFSFHQGLRHETLMALV